MGKTTFADKLKRLFGIHTVKDESFFDELSDVLIEGDLGAKNVFELIDTLEKKCRTTRITDEQTVLKELKTMLLEYVHPVELTPVADSVNIYMLLGVNGVGKTTTAAKLASYYQRTGESHVILAAADTFRAAAIEQLQMHGDRLGIRVVAHQHGADPSAVVFDAAEAAASKGGGLVLADTAGRLHNKENLVRELQKIDRIAASKSSADCYKKLLVIDSTTGQNALRQAEVFHEAIGVDAVVLTKYDSTAKGGIAVAIGRELGIPTAFICFGESYTDIRPFEPEQYIDEFLGLV